jgi:hypothetical protein
MKKILVAVILLFSVSTFAETTQNVGFTFGSTHGSGIHYSRQNTDGYGWQVTGLPIWTENEKVLTTGIAVFRTLHQGKKGRVFLTVGGSWFYNESTWENWPRGEGPPTKVTDKEVNILFGPGIGIERVFAENFALSLVVPACACVGCNDGLQILPIPNFSIGYRW